MQIEPQQAEVDWVAASGSGVVHSNTRVQHATHVAFEERVPYLVVTVDLGSPGPALDRCRWPLASVNTRGRALRPTATT